MEKLEPSYTAHGNVKRRSLFGNSLAVAQKVKVTIWLRSHTPRYIPKRNENIGPHKNLYCTWMFRAALLIMAKKWEKPKCPSSDEWINNMWYITQWAITCSQKGMKPWYMLNMVELWKYYSKRETSQRRTNSVWFHSYEISTIGKSMEAESRLVISQG